MKGFPKVMNVSDVTAVPTSDQREELGAIAYTQDTTNGLRKWKYVQFDNGTGDVASAANSVAFYIAASYKDSIVTCDCSDSDPNYVAGVFTQAFTDQYYGWILVGGKATVATDGADDISATDALIGSASTDGTCDSVAADTAPTNKVLGWALAADVDASNTVSAYLTVGEF